MVLAIFLSAIVGWAALSVAVRMRFDGRAETLTATLVLASAFVLGPIYVLGVSGALTRAMMTAFVMLVAAGAWAASTAEVGVRDQVRATARAAVGVLRMPVDAVAECAHARSVALIGLGACAVLFAWNLLAAWLAPSWREWDALWYHESIVGFSIQNHGFAPVDLPLGGMQKINGYPRAAEMLSLWFAMYAGRALVDLPNVLLMPGLFASTYAMSRRLTGDRIASCGWAAVATTIPGYVELLQSTYVDPALATFVAAGAMFVLRSPPRAREALVGAAALAIAANVKVSGVFPVVALAVIAAGELLAQPGRKRAALLAIGGGAAMIVGLSATTYLRNLRLYHNPVWPDLSVHVKSLGIDWPGNGPLGSVASGSDWSPGVVKSAPLSELIHDLFRAPGALTDPVRKQMPLYGLGVPYVLLPAAALVFSRLAVEAVRGLRACGPLIFRRYIEALGLVVTAGITFLTSINRWLPRYHLSTIALWVPVVAWAIGRRRALQEALAFAAIVGSVVVIVWELPGWRGFPSTREMVALWHLDPTLRQMTPELGGPIFRDVGLAREHDLVAGTTVVSDNFAFPSLLWNDDFSNRVVYARPNADLVDTAEKLDATWIYANDKAAAERVRARPGWQELGPLYVEKWGTAFRRAR
ncbi:MAG TPA: hypothetical protein VF765_30320 [Polyangiaceae bacterium]